MNRYALPIAILVLSLVTGSVLYRTISSRRQRQEVEADLFAPYFKAIGEARYNEAWSYHTPAWRSHHGLDEFKGFYTKLISVKGRIRDHVVASTANSPNGVIVDYQIQLESESVPVTYRIVAQPEQERWGIDAGDATAGAYRDQTLPW